MLLFDIITGRCCDDNENVKIKKGRGEFRLR